MLRPDSNKPLLAKQLSVYLPTLVFVLACVFTSFSFDRICSLAGFTYNLITSPRYLHKIHY